MEKVKTIQEPGIKDLEESINDAHEAMNDEFVEEHGLLAEIKQVEHTYHEGVHSAIIVFETEENLPER